MSACGITFILTEVCVCGGGRTILKATRQLVTHLFMESAATFAPSRCAALIASSAEAGVFPFVHSYLGGHGVMVLGSPPARRTSAVASNEGPSSIIFRSVGLGEVVAKVW